MYCSNCGQKQDDQASFCSNCGKKINLNSSKSDLESPAIKPVLEHPISKHEVEKIYVLASHLGGAFLTLLAPLVVYLLKKDEKPTNDWVIKNAANSINFQATILSLFLGIFLFDWILLKFIESNITLFNYKTLSNIAGFIGFISLLAMLILIVFDLVQCVIAATKAVSGNIYCYPYAYDFINKFTQVFDKPNINTDSEFGSTQGSKKTNNLNQSDEVEDGCRHCGGWNPDGKTICQYCKKSLM
jgi:uncharacterized Tic20 family protein